MLGKTRFRLTFAKLGKRRPFLETIDLARAEENVDFFHICQAYWAVEGWVQNRDPCTSSSYCNTCSTTTKRARRESHLVQLADGDNPVDAFTRLNVGKIPLTNDELIRALFLKRSGPEDSESEGTQFGIAYEWDLLEKALQCDTFSYFLSNQKGRNRKPDWVSLRADREIGRTSGRTGKRRLTGSSTLSTLS